MARSIECNSSRTVHQTKGLRTHAFSPSPSALLLLTLLIQGPIASGAQVSQARSTEFGTTSGPAVVFVPGVTGSRLENQQTGEVIWGNASQVFSPRDRGYSTVLPLLEQDAEKDTTFTAGVLSHLKLLGYTKEIYRPLRRFLEKQGYHTGDIGNPSPRENLYLFAYDWRRENQAAVNRLHAALSKLAQSRANPNIRLLCQSNAGRICRYLAKYGALEPALLWGSHNSQEDLAKLLNPPTYVIEQVVLISNSHGGSLRQLHELHKGRKYVPGIGRFMGPETLFALRTLFEDLPYYRDDLFLDRKGVPLKIDLFDPQAWQRYQWSIFAPNIRKLLESKNPNGMFSDLEGRIAYLSERLQEANQVNQLLLADSPIFTPGLCLLQNTTAPTIERAVLFYDQRKKEWRTLFAGDKGVPRDLAAKLTSPGDGHGTSSSQDFLSAQELKAVTARHKIEGGHFDTITRKQTLSKLLDCLEQE